MSKHRNGPAYGPARPAGRRVVQCATQVEELEIQLLDGRSYVFAFDMAALALLEDERADDGGAFGYLSELQERIKTHPIGAFCETLFIGVRARHPDVTLDEIARSVPFDPAIMEAMYETMSAVLPAGDNTERPTIPSLELT